MAISGYNDRGIKGLIKALKNPPSARIGILSGQYGRSTPLAESLKHGASESKVRKLRREAIAMGGRTNAEIGAAHEYGAPARKLPQRSWLRVPLLDHMSKEIEKRPLLMRATFQRAARDGTLLQFLGQIGTIAEAVVRTGFTNNGYGKWAPLKASYAARKTVNNILVETTQLRESVTHIIVQGK